MVKVLDVGDNKNNRDNFPFEFGRQRKKLEMDNIELYRIFGLCLTDFWGMCFQPGFRKDHERSFWVEHIVPLFKNLGASNQVVFSWCEDHSKTNQENQRDPGAWLNTTNSIFADGIGRRNAQEKIFMESSSGFSAESYEHSIEDSVKIIGFISSSSNTILRRKQDCKVSSIVNLAVFGIQCIKRKSALTKTTLKPFFQLFSNCRTT